MSKSLGVKEKWEITIDLLMIVGKYFESNNDYINVMKVSKKYKELVQMYHFNPISDCSLFENMETQYLNNPNEQRIRGMYQYVYCILLILRILKIRKVMRYSKELN